MRRGGLFLLAALLCCAGRWALSQGPAVGRSEHPDEGLWAASGKRAFERTFLERDLPPDEWLDPRLGPFDGPNPSFGKLLVGASLYAHDAVRHDAALEGYEDLGVGLGPTARAVSFPPYDWSELRARRPGAAPLRAARAPLGWLAAALPALLFLFVTRALGSPLAGLAAATALLVRPLFLEQGRLAMMDTPATALGLAALLLLVPPRSTRDEPSGGESDREPDPARSATPGDGLGAGPPGHRPTSVARALTAGTCAGLATATKLTGLLAPLLGLAWILLRPGRDADDPEGLRQALPPGLARTRAAVLFTLSAVAAFWLANPPLHRTPVAGLAPMLELAAEVPRYDVPHERRLDGVPARLDALLRVGIGDDAPLAHWTGLPFADAFLACCGLFVLARGLRREPGRRPATVLLGLWALASCGLVLATTPFDWRRWYVPMEPVWATCSGLGLLFLLRLPFTHSRPDGARGAAIPSSPERG